MLNKLIKEIAEKHNVPQALVEAIIKSQFKFVKQIIEKGECESIRLKYLGIFGVTKYREELKSKHLQMRMERDYNEKDQNDEIC